MEALDARVEAMERRFANIETSLERILHKLDQPPNTSSTSAGANAGAPPATTSEAAPKVWSALAKVATPEPPALPRGASSSKSWAVLRNTARRDGSREDLEEIVEARRAAETAALLLERGDGPGGDGPGGDGADEDAGRPPTSDARGGGLQHSLRKVVDASKGLCHVWMPWERAMIWSDLIAIVAVLYIAVEVRGASPLMQHRPCRAAHPRSD